MEKPTANLHRLTQLAWPVFVSQLATMAGGVVDTVMAGHLQPEDLAAVGVGSSIYFSIFVTVMGVLIALTPIVARLHGADRQEEIGEEVRQSAWLALALSGLCLLFLACPEPLLALSQLQPAVEAKVRTYLAFLAWGVPPLLLFRVFYGLSTAVSLPRPVMMFNLLALGLKIPLNGLFMYGGLGLPALGGPGCGLASSVLNWLVLFLSLWWCRRQDAYAPFALFKRWSWPDRRIMGAQLKLGLPIGATFLVDVTAYTFMALFIARLGPLVSAAHQVAANLGALCFMLPMSLGHAASVLVGQALGAGKAREARHSAFLGMTLALGLALPVSLALWFGRDAIAGLYVSDARVAAIASGLIAIVALYHLADAIQASAVNVLRGFHRTVVPMVIYATALWGVGLGGGYVLGLTDVSLPLGLAGPMGATGFWIAAVASLVVAGALAGGYLERISRPKEPHQP
ncbi:MAG: MATE family efflux transporter [Rhodocyclaceae bacterium]|nr:MATE family efflux transporter [Rhodocyclaceae bacterium]